ncbi:MAG TPA: WbqC family protein [Bacteroidales bacterium]|nr:WbqC family protein [Bacteroidales bacterium]
MIFSTAYLPPISFFVYAFHADELCIEACENFIKQTYRNRCYIYSANGKLGLSIPLDHCRRPQLPLKDVKINYATPWHHIHWRAITAAYNKSAYFLYYRDDFEKFFVQKYDWLIDFNHEILAVCLKQLRLSKKITYTEKFHNAYATGDLRAKINPRNEPEFILAPYTQVFDVKSGFISNLSIIDLLFNCGPDSLEYLEHTSTTKIYTDKNEKRPR